MHCDFCSWTISEVAAHFIEGRVVIASKLDCCDRWRFRRKAGSVAKSWS